MTEKGKVLLGYRVGSGTEVAVELHHLVATGLTQLSGKTTTLEALIARSGRTAVAFRTKRGEIGFDSASPTRPYYVAGERWGDWQYVEGVLEATMKQRMRFERSWIIRLCKGARGPEDVYRNVVAKLEGKRKLRSIDESVYINLRAYLDIVLPVLRRTRFAPRLELQPGANVMDLTAMPVEVQGLVIRAVLDEILAKRRDTIVILPEAWKFLPQRRGSPVKWAAEQWKKAWTKTYRTEEASMDEEERKRYLETIEGLRAEIEELREKLAEASRGAAGEGEQIVHPTPDTVETPMEMEEPGAAEIHAARKAEQEFERGLGEAIASGSATKKHYRMAVTLGVPCMEVHETEYVIKADGADPKGRLALLVSEGFFDQGRSIPDVIREFNHRVRGSFGGGSGKASMTNNVRALAALGFLEYDERLWKAAPGVKGRITRRKTRQEA